MCSLADDCLPWCAATWWVGWVQLNTNVKLHLLRLSARGTVPARAALPRPVEGLHRDHEGTRFPVRRVRPYSFEPCSASGVAPLVRLLWLLVVRNARRTSTGGLVDWSNKAKGLVCWGNKPRSGYTRHNGHFPPTRPSFIAPAARQGASSTATDVSHQLASGRVGPQAHCGEGDCRASDSVRAHARIACSRWPASTVGGCIARYACLVESALRASSVSVDVGVNTGSTLLLWWRLATGPTSYSANALQHCAKLCHRPLPSPQ